MLRFFQGRIVDTMGRTETWKWNEAHVGLSDVLSLESGTLRVTKFQFPVKVEPIIHALPAVHYETSGGPRTHGSYWEPHMAIMLCDPVTFQAKLAVSQWESSRNGEWIEWRR